MNATSPSHEPQRTIPEMLSRGYWMMFGPLLLVPVVFKLIEHGQGWFTPYDLAYWVVVLAMLAARAFEFYKGAPRTAEGGPATWQHFQRYAAGVIVGSVVGWVIANVLANHV